MFSFQQKNKDLNSFLIPTPSTGYPFRFLHTILLIIQIIKPESRITEL
jgi:hypothetical protein